MSQQKILLSSELKSLNSCIKNNEDRIAYFIADLHLMASRPDLSAAFFLLLQEIEQDATDLFILGDFFNYWSGDDIATPLTESVSQALSKLANKGINIFFQHGNRDFALGKRYANACSMTILPEVYVLPFTPEIIILHGDQLCLEDVKYQRYRTIIRHPFVLCFLRALPRLLRIKIAHKLRRASKNHQTKKISQKPLHYFDVTESAVEDMLQKNSASIMIHGHTHKPNQHQHTSGTRWVLSHWDETGDYLKWNKSNGITRHTFTIKGVNQ